MTNVIQALSIGLLASIVASIHLDVADNRSIIVTLNDVYASILVSGWVLILTSVILDGHRALLVVGALLVVFMYIAIRRQAFVTPKQYLQGLVQNNDITMIMSHKQLEQKDLNPAVRELANSEVQDAQRKNAAIHAVLDNM